MVGSVQGSSTSDVNTVAQQLQDFKDGKVNISKSDLKKSAASVMTQGQKPSDSVIDIIDSYEKIDTNGDGISYKELESYKNTTAGLLSSLGMSPNAMKQQKLSLFSSVLSQDDSLPSSLFSSNDSDDEISFLKSGKLGDNASRLLNNYSPNNTGTSSSASYLDTLL